MGTDIHMAVQVRAVSGYTRRDDYVRRLQHDVVAEPSREPELNAIEIRQGEWELVAVNAYPGEQALTPGWRAETINTRQWPTPSGKPYISTDDVLTTLAVLPLPWWEGRNYAAFGRLAGIRRSDCDKISEPRGLPPGLSWEDFPEEEGHYGPSRTEIGDHSFSYLTCQEILESDVWVKHDWTPPALTATDWEVGKMAKGWADRFGAENVRLVFGFDS